MEDSHINMDICKKNEVNRTNITTEGETQASNSKSNATEETRENPNPYLLPNYCDKERIKGKVVIVVNEKFQHSILRRRGAKKDLDNLKHVFIDQLGFEQLNVKQHFNLLKSELENVLAETAKLDYNDTDLFVFAISTHGEERPRQNQQNEHALMCSDDEFVFTIDIINKFSSIPSLTGKPKIFFIQACRIPYGADVTQDSDVYDPGHKVKILTKLANEETVTENNEKPHAIQETVDAGHRSEDAQTSQSQGEVIAGHRIENEGRSQQGSGDPGQNSIHFLSYNRCPKDCLVVYAIQSGLLAWRSDGDGSWMFHYLHEAIRSYKDSSFVDFFDVLTKTAFGMANRESNTGENISHGRKAVPVIQHRLTKHLSIPL